jgi:hypothetical protein
MHNSTTTAQQHSLAWHSTHLCESDILPLFSSSITSLLLPLSGVVVAVAVDLHSLRKLRLTFFIPVPLIATSFDAALL